MHTDELTLAQVVPAGAYISSAAWYNAVTTDGSLSFIPASSSDPGLRACITLVGMTSTLTQIYYSIAVNNDKVLAISAAVDKSVVGTVTSTYDGTATSPMASVTYTAATKSVCATLPNVAAIFMPARDAPFTARATATFSDTKTITKSFSDLSVKVCLCFSVRFLLT